MKKKFYIKEKLSINFRANKKKQVVVIDDCRDGERY